MSAPLLPQPPGQYDQSYFTSLLRTLGLYFRSVEAVKHVNVASQNFDTNTLPTSSTGLRDGDVWVDGSVLRIAGLSGSGVGEKIQALGNVSGSVSVNLSLGRVVTATCTGGCTWSFTNLTTGEVNNVTLVLTNPGVGTQTFPSGTVFDRTVAPTLSAAGKTALMFETYDNGTSWAAAQVWRNTP